MLANESRDQGSLLQVSNLEVSFDTPGGRVQAVNGLSFELEAGGTLGIVGESGSGKTQTALTILGLLDGNSKTAGSIRFDGQELLNLPSAELNKVRGARIGMVFQDPMTSLNPHLKIGAQLSEVLIRHLGLSQAAAQTESARLLDAVQIGGVAQRLLQYPHEFSGGMRQRVMIAIAIACRPRLLIADEPTTALDVTIQAQILRLLADLRREFNLAVLLITHDLGVVAELCENLLVLYAGQTMERGAADALLSRPTHPYTQGLLRSRPSLEGLVGQALAAIPGTPPDLGKLPAGCPFEARCAHAFEPCAKERPALLLRKGIQRACHLEIDAAQ